MLRNGLEAPLPSAVSVPESFPLSFYTSAVSFFHVVSRSPRNLLRMTDRAFMRAKYALQ